MRHLCIALCRASSLGLEYVWGASGSFSSWTSSGWLYSSLSLLETTTVFSTLRRKLVLESLAEDSFDRWCLSVRVTSCKIWFGLMSPVRALYHADGICVDSLIRSFSSAHMGLKVAFFSCFSMVPKCLTSTFPFSETRSTCAIPKVPSGV